MGTCEQQANQPEQPPQRLDPEEGNLLITGPPASRTVIDNLKKLLVQRQHSRESDTENNKNAARSNSGSNSDAAFYSQFSTSSSDSDDSSDDYMIFQEISNQAECAANGSATNHGRRRHRRRRSYSSSSSSSPSPVARSRRKVTRVNVTLTSSSIGGDGEDVVESVMKAATASGSPHCQQLPSSLEEVRQEKTKEEHDSANSTSSHKDSSSEDDIPGSGSTAASTTQQGNKGLSSSATPGLAGAEGAGSGSTTGGRCPKLKSRRDRDRKRKRSELNYATHRPTKLLKGTGEGGASTTNQEALIVTATGGGNEASNISVPSSDTNTSLAENSGNDGVTTAGAENSSQSNMDQ